MDFRIFYLKSRDIHIVEGFLLSRWRRVFQLNQNFPLQAIFFRCLARKSRSPWDFLKQEWCYQPDGGGARLLSGFFIGKSQWLAFFGPLPALAGLSVPQ
jgi:hypothetical protein